MTFQDKVEFLRTLPAFKVIPISEVRAIAFAAKEKSKADQEDFVVGQRTQKNLITLNPTDIKKIVRNYPDLATKLVEKHLHWG